MAQTVRNYVFSTMKNVAVLRRPLISSRPESTNCQHSLQEANGSPVPAWINSCKSWIRWIEDLLNIRRQVYQRAARILQIITRERCNALVACSGDLIDLPASFYAARWADVPFYAYMFDDYATNSVPCFQRRFAQEMTARLVRQAAGVVVPNEFLARVYQQRYGIEPRIISNPAELDADTPLPLAPTGRPVRIVYTGAVYEAHYDAVYRLIAALRTMRESGPELHIYTSTSRKNLEQHHLGSPAVIHDAVPAVDATRLQREADILFLPLAFDSPIPETINTSAPGKMGELLASGRPVLVHAPRDAFVSWYFRKHDCGAVVDTKDAVLLQQAIKRLTFDLNYRQQLVLHAKERALADFSLPVAQGRFLEMLNMQ
jgi:glycosyltransferase involved in cell wall biosynthesis